MMIPGISRLLVGDLTLIYYSRGQCAGEIPTGLGGFANHSVDFCFLAGKNEWQTPINKLSFPMGRVSAPFATLQHHEEKRFSPMSHHRVRRSMDELTYQTLEPRQLLAAANPTNFDQYVIELINFARANPATYASQLGISLNEGLPAGTISTAKKQPLALNRFITDAARQHSQWMLDNNVLSHTGANGSNPGQRMSSSGYVFKNPSSWAENIAVRSTNGSVNMLEFTKSLQEALFIDKNYPGRAHRVVMMDDNLMEIGVGVVQGKYKGNNGVMMTQDFAYSAGHAFLTGVAYQDTVTKDKFYTPGEGLGGIAITAIRDGGGQTFRTTTTSSGGYSLQLPKGRYSIMASGTDLGKSQFLPAVLMGTKNRKLDFVKGVVREAPEVALFGNNRSIIHSINQPSAEQHTHFGTVNIGTTGVTRTYTIRNHGNLSLVLNGSPRVISSNPSEFRVMTMPSSSIAGGATSTFSVQFTPAGAGLRTATIQFANNDGNENPFVINIAGVGGEGMPPAGMLGPGDQGGTHGGGGDNGGDGFAMARPPQGSQPLTLSGLQGPPAFALDQTIRQMASEGSDLDDEIAWTFEV
jgi:uncharacterized protein YkwD